LLLLKVLSYNTALIKRVEKTNVVVARNSLQEQGERGEIRKDSYAMDVDRRRNCYNCRGFGHIARNCRNWSIVGQRKRIEYGDNFNHKNNLKEEESLVVLS